MTRRRSPWGTILVIITLAVYLVPLFYVVLASLKSNVDIVNNPAGLIFAPTLDGYAQALEGPLLLSVRNSAIIALGTTAVVLVLSVPLAHGLARINVRWTALIVGLLVALQMVPTATSIIPLFRVLGLMGLVGTFWAVIIAIAATNIPFVTIILRPFFTSIPAEVLEAAEMDGAGRLRTFLSVALPLARNGVMVIGILTIIGAWGDLIFSVSFLRSSELQPLSVLMSQQQTVYGTNWNALMAVAIIGAIPTIVLFALVSRKLMSGIAVGYGK